MIPSPKRLLALAVTGLCLSTAHAEVPPQMTVYMFGFAASFVDSVAYITDVQQVDSAYVEKKSGFLADRTLYSSQLSGFLLTEMKQENMTCAVFWDKSKTKVEKKYAKVVKSYRNDRAVFLSPLGSDVFHFEREEWVEPMEYEESIYDEPRKTEGEPPHL